MIGIVRTGSPWRYLPNDLPPWEAVFQQAQRWIKADCFNDIVNDLRALLRLAVGKKAPPSTAIYDGQTLQGTIESGNRAGYDGHKKKNGSKIHVAVDSLGYLLGIVVTPANEQERSQVAELSRQVQEVTGKNVKLAWVDQGYTGLYRARSKSCCRATWHRTGSRETTRREEGVCATAASLDSHTCERDSRALLFLEESISSFSTRL